MLSIVFDLLTYQEAQKRQEEERIYYACFPRELSLVKMEKEISQGSRTLQQITK